MLAALSRDGNVRLVVPDSNTARGPPLPPATETPVSPLDAQPQDLILKPTGKKLVAQNDAQDTSATGATTNRSGIWAKLDISLWIGDDVDAPAGTAVVAGRDIFIHGDVNIDRLATGGTTQNPDSLGGPVEADADGKDADDNWGTTMMFAGRVGGVFDVDGTADDTRLTAIFGHLDVDSFTFSQATLGAPTTVYGSEDTTAGDSGAHGDGEDFFLVDHLESMAVLHTTSGTQGETLTLDGQDRTDLYVVKTWGSQEPQARSYIVNVLDTGASDDGVDVLEVWGADGTLNGYALGGGQFPADDIFLLRRMSSIPGQNANRPAFVAVLRGTLDQLTASDPDGLASIRPQQVERVNYDAAINGRLVVYGLGGNDVFAVDDNSAITTLDGGLGNDSFQIGQLYGSKRDSANPTTTAGITSGGSLTTQDVFGTVATTRGWLSAGATSPLVAVGDKGDDVFTVYSNQAAVRLEGGDDNDQFIVRAFALAQTTGNCSPNVNDPTCEIVWRDAAAGVAMPRLTSGFSTAAETDIRTGGGNNQVQYNVNAPVSIDGGGGIDKVVVLGTEFADHIVVTEKAIYGAGLSVSYAQVELLEIDGLEGDDTFDVLSTAPGVATRVIGGLGSDTINVAGDVAGDVVSRDVEGTSGTVNHDVSSTDPLYNGIVAGGVDVSVARGGQGQVVIEETDGFTDVTEGGAADTYLVYLAAKPTGKVYVTISAARSPRSEQLAPGKGDTLWLSEVPPVIAAVDYDRDIYIDGESKHIPKHAIVLVFTPTAWAKTGPEAGAKSVSLLAANDTLAEGDRVVVVSHAVISSDPAFDNAIVRNVEVTIHDDDRASIQVVELDPVSGNRDNTTVVVEGTALTGLADVFDVKLSIDPSGPVTLRLTPSNDRVVLSGTSGFSTIVARGPGVAGVYQIVIDDSNKATGVRVTVRAADDSVRQDPRTTTIGVAVLPSASADEFDDALPARVDALVVDDDTAGVVVVESDGATRVVAGTTAGGPGPGDNYRMRLTLQPTGTVRIALVTDGQTDVTAGGRIVYESIGGLRAFQQFAGDIAVTGAIVARAGEAALGNFLDEGFAPGQLIRIANAGAANGDFTIASVSLDGKSLTLTTAPTAGSYADALISRLVTRGLYTGGVSYDFATGALTRTDGTSWLDSGFLEGQLIKIGADPTLYKIELISGTAANRLDVMRLTDKAKPANGSVPAGATITQWAAVLTFDGTNWYQPVTVPLVADPWFDLQPGRENLKSFPKRAHLLSGLRGPLAVEGGTTAADRSLKQAIMLPGEANRPLFAIAPQPQEAQQVDTLNVFSDSSQEDLVGTLTATSLTGLNMSSGLDFTPLLGGNPMPFGEPAIYPGGISYGKIVVDPITKAFLPAGSTTTIEVLNILLGEGNDRLTITGTLVPGADHNADGSLGQVAVHGGITTVHGGGNARLDVRGPFTVSGSTLTRADGVSWTSAGFAVGQQVTVDGTPVGTVVAASGADLIVSGALPAVQAGSVVAVRDPKTGQTRIGGDTIVVTGGAGPASPLVVYGDTSQDGIWYSGDPRVHSIRDFGTKPFPSEIGNGTPNFFFPVATAYRFAGHDTIDASALFAGAATGALPSVGLTAYGGVGDDLLIGSHAGDFLAGGSGDDEIRGLRGSDHVYGDNGVNVDVIARTLTIPWVNSSVRAVRDPLTAGRDLLFGDSAGSVANTPLEYDDVIFGDYGTVAQDVLTALVGPAGYVRSLAKPQKIQTTSRIREIRTTRPEHGANDEIHGNGGRDRIFGGNADDTITGDGDPNVVFGDHGRMQYIDGADDVTTLHLVESIDVAQGGIDTITANGGDDFVLGGARGDLIHAGDGQNVVFGDHGRITGVEGDVYNRPIPESSATLPAATPPHDDYQIPVLQLVESISAIAGAEHGGDDRIFTGIGRDMIFGGAAERHDPRERRRERSCAATGTTSSSATTASSIT